MLPKGRRARLASQMLPRWAGETTFSVYHTDCVFCPPWSCWLYILSKFQDCCRVPAQAQSFRFSLELQWKTFVQCLVLSAKRGRAVCAAGHVMPADQMENGWKQWLHKCWLCLSIISHYEVWPCTAASRFWSHRKDKSKLHDMLLVRRASRSLLYNCPLHCV